MRAIRSDDQIYTVLDDFLEKASSPVTCADLMDIPDVRAAAIVRWGKDIQRCREKLSDTLGFMWRREVLDRFTAPFAENGRARWCYALKGRFEDYDTPKVYKKPEKTKNSGDLEIIEKDGEVVISLKGFTITVKPK